MSKIKILHIGIKNWPYYSSFGNQSLKGLRGGGMNKYCTLLISSLPSEFEIYIITQRLRGEKRTEDICNAQTIRMRVFGNRAFRQVLANLFSIFVAFRVIRRQKIDIIHGHMQPGIFVAYVLARLFRKKSIGTPYSFATTETKGIVNSLTKLIEKYFYSRLDALIFETEENLKKAYELRKLIFPNARVIHTGIEVPSLTNKKKLGQKIKLLFVGRLVRIKAIQNLIEGIDLLDKSIQEKIIVDIIGEGELLDYHKKICSEKQLDHFVNIHGFVQNTETFWQNADVFTLVSDREGLSISLLEAMSYGKACIINDFGVPFSKEEVFIMPDNKPGTIANHITMLVNNPEIIIKYGANARERIIKDFSVEAFSRKYCEVYKDLME